MVPRMSGTGRPPSNSPCSTCSVGQVMGTVSTTLFTPSLPACTQNDVPPRVEATLGGFTGRKPHLKTGGSFFTPARSGK